MYLLSFLVILICHAEKVSTVSVLFSVFQPLQFNSATWAGSPRNQTSELAIGAGEVIPPVFAYKSFTEGQSIPEMFWQVHLQCEKLLLYIDHPHLIDSALLK